MSCKINETCWIEDVFLDGSSEATDIPLHMVSRIRQLHMTNKRFDQFNISHTEEKKPSKEIRESEGVLFCRFRLRSVYESLEQKRKGCYNSFSEKSLATLDVDDIDVGWLDDSSDRSRNHRQMPRHASEEVIDNVSSLSRRSSTETLVGDEVS